MMKRSAEELKNVRITPAFRQELKIAAAREGLTMTEMAVKVFRYYQEHFGEAPPPKKKPRK